ncbi:MAG: flavin reductase family protein [Hyphomonadaceae bacterium]|jgi:flavin reductase (DIM6/NTAB) family NADH-FMN oxidoreductase RutF|nr:flavin reductase family protein [Hyphomonadaceae bacterium]
MKDQKTAASDHTLFREVMGSFATGVTVITTEARGEVRGMTANAFMSGSLEPPLCVISVATRARIHPLLIEAGHFGVSILAKDQEKLSTHFAGGPVADTAPEFVRVGRTPLLANASAVIAAETIARHECGDHSIFIGRIVHLEASGRAPLIVHEGRYASLTYSMERAPEWVADFW